ncbi:hypothetical protein DL768_007622 [Monosporascus sp. mg162]|nr:hypothetical protein DL768_007622 [Monosporascus sp. mg162]
MENDVAPRLANPERWPPRRIHPYGAPGSPYCIDNRTEAERTEVERPKPDGGGGGGVEAGQPVPRAHPRGTGAGGSGFCAWHGIEGEDDVRAFRLGAMIAGDMNRYDAVAGLTAREREALDPELTHKWRNPSTLYAVIVICSPLPPPPLFRAWTTVINGAHYFVICCAFFGCWATEPMNKRFGHRGTVFISLISAVTCFWQAFTNTWWHMFNARFSLGFGVVPKSATTPIFAAECSPLKPRGALVMQWQMWTAFGIMLGYVTDLAFSHVPDGRLIGLNWRLMMGSAMMPAVVACAIVYVVPEYPTEIFIQSGFQEQAALAASLGFGVINWLFAIPGIYTVDTFGRRKLLLTTLPFMSLFLLLTDFSFWVSQESTAHLACIVVGIYLFGVVYSPGEGPVPFTYSAEAYPLSIRATGMSLATATTWFFNAIISLTWPLLVAAWTEQGAFSWYASWNFVGLVAVLLFLPRIRRSHSRNSTPSSTCPPRGSPGTASLNSSTSGPITSCAGTLSRRKRPSSSENIEYARKRFSKERESDPTARL